MPMAISAQAAIAAMNDGRDAEAISILGQMHAAANPEGFLLSGLWRIEGRALPRDLTASRRDFGRAADLGHQGAARIHAGMLASGAGGDADWPGALAILDNWAERDCLAARQAALIEGMDLSWQGEPATLPAPEPLSNTPAIALFRHAFTTAECRMLIDLAEARLKPARIFHEGQQRFVVDPVRNSDVAGFPLVFEWPFVVAVNRRIAAASGAAYQRGEPLQLLRYRPGQEYRPHLDAVPGLANQRVLTALIYLNDGYTGGETLFTKAGISVRGAVGDLLVFANVTEDGRPDPASEHQGAKVSAGTKFVASRWIRAQIVDPDQGVGPEEVRSV